MKLAPHFVRLALTAITAASLLQPAANARALTIAEAEATLARIEQSLEQLLVEKYLTGISDVVFTKPIVVVNDAVEHSVISSESKQEDLLGGNVFGVDAPEPILNVYLVDRVTFCGQYNYSLAGCADQPGRHLYFEGQQLRRPTGDELFAHELAHALGLVGHVGGKNLMNKSIRNGVTTLDPEQIRTIKRSPLIDQGKLTLRVILISSEKIQPPPRQRR